MQDSRTERQRVDETQEDSFDGFLTLSGAVALSSVHAGKLVKIEPNAAATQVTIQSDVQGGFDGSETITVTHRGTVAQTISIAPGSNVTMSRLNNLDASTVSLIGPGAIAMLVRTGSNEWAVLGDITP